jgi:hypothetical protein
MSGTGILLKTCLMKFTEVMAAQRSLAVRIFPAMAAGVTDHVWSVADIVSMIEAAEPAPKARTVQEAVSMPNMSDPKVVRFSLLSAIWLCLVFFGFYSIERYPDGIVSGLYIAVASTGVVVAIAWLWNRLNSN